MIGLYTRYATRRSKAPASYKTLWLDWFQYNDVLAVFFKAL